MFHRRLADNFPNTRKYYKNNNLVLIEFATNAYFLKSEQCEHIIIVYVNFNETF